MTDINYRPSRYFVAGNNLFGQWYNCDDTIVESFKCLSEQNSNFEFDVKQAELVHIGWSHNIFQCNQDYYITGDYKYSGKYSEKLSLPEECLNCSNLTIISNDNYLVFVNKNTCTVWCLNLDTRDVKKFELNVEGPSKKHKKKSKRETHIAKCAIANNHILFLTNRGSVYSGLPPTLVDTGRCLGKPIDVQCGNEHYVLLTNRGLVYTWGEGWRLQMGNGGTKSYSSPMEVGALAGMPIIKIAAGGWHTMALTDFGDVYVWGWNDMGQLGITVEFNIDIPNYGVPIWAAVYSEDGREKNEYVIDIACGSKHSAMLFRDHSVWTSGNNKYGQLGFPTDINTTVQDFKLVGFFKDACKVMCGPWSTVVLQKEREEDTKSEK